MREKVSSERLNYRQEKNYRRCAEEKLDETGAGLGALLLHSFQITVIHEMCGIGCKVRVNFGNWYFRVVLKRRTVPTLVLFRRFSE
jgi:hypothetical protein